ncbi:MAG: NnrU family protein [Rhodobacter sp.]|nr:NnrU family protein [Rhodobacter sp.]
MIWQLALFLGLVLWWGAHLFKRLAPARRVAMTDRMGEAARGPIAFTILISVVLIVIGFRGSDFVPVYDPPGWGRPVNNILMLIAVALMGLGSSKSRARRLMRHPMLTGFLIWAVAHLLVNGDRDSIIMFGALGLWALVQMVLINRAEPDWQRFEGGSVAGDIRLAVISLVVFAVIAAVHIWLGYNPFKA